MRLNENIQQACKLNAPSGSAIPSMIRRLVIASGLILLLILIRSPFLNDLLCGEEGEFAFLVASPIPSAELSNTGLPRGMMANIGGQLYLGTFSRTVMPYFLLESLVGSLTRSLNIMALPNPDHRAVLVHLIFLSIFLFGCLGAIWRSSSTSIPAILSVLWALSTPIAVGASIQPQLDGTIGVLLLGLTAWISSMARRPLMQILAGIFSGLGKHEWAMAFFVAAMLTIFFEKIVTGNINKRLFYFLLGLFIGVVLSIYMSYSDYAAGFDVMRSFFGEESPLYLASKNFRYLAPTVIIMSICGVMILMNFKNLLLENSLVFMLYLGGSAILCGFALSGHNPDLPRYFTPPLVIFVYVFLAMLPYCINIFNNKNLITLILCLGFIFNIQYLIFSFSNNFSITTCATTMPDLTLQKKMYDDAKRQNKAKQIPVVSSGIWLYSPEVFFVEESVTKAGGLRILKQFNRENEFQIIEP